MQPRLLILLCAVNAKLEMEHIAEVFGILQSIAIITDNTGVFPRQQVEKKL